MTNTLLPTPRRLRTGLRTLAEAAVTPLVPADFLDLLAPVRSRTSLRAKIVAVLPETGDVATIVLRPGPSWRPHVPGQFLRIGVDVDGVRHWRAYSLTSSPRQADGCISITVKAIVGGTVSNHLVRHARRGQVVQLDQAAGEFCLPQHAPAKTLFVAAGSGVTPVMGMLRSRLDELGDVIVVHCARTDDDAIFSSELRAMAAAGRLRLIERFSDRDGRLTPADLVGLVADLAERVVWACGPGGLLDALQSYADGAGLSDRFHVERFQSTVIDAGEGGSATFVRAARTVEVDGATSLLDAGEDAGVLMPSGCRMGICFGCVVPLRSGAVRDLRTGEVTRAEPGDDVTIQTCINTAASACDIDC
ncbi:MAG: ferredoxin-NADP reductase [Glaciecola sp.]|jgi:ferredoxin-NADP reductase